MQKLGNRNKDVLEEELFREEARRLPDRKGQGEDNKLTIKRPNNEMIGQSFEPDISENLVGDTGMLLWHDYSRQILLVA